MKSFCSCHILKIFPSSGLFDVPNGPRRSYFIISISPAADTNPDRKDSKWLLGKEYSEECVNRKKSGGTEQEKIEKQLL